LGVVNIIEDLRSNLDAVGSSDTVELFFHSSARLFVYMEPITSHGIVPFRLEVIVRAVALHVFVKDLELDVVPLAVDPPSPHVFSQALPVHLRYELVNIYDNLLLNDDVLKFNGALYIRDVIEEIHCLPALHDVDLILSQFWLYRGKALSPLLIFIILAIILSNSVRNRPLVCTLAHDPTH
jgi:hypothetical protein